MAVGLQGKVEGHEGSVLIDQHTLNPTTLNPIASVLGKHPVGRKVCYLRSNGLQEYRGQHYVVSGLHTDIYSMHELFHL